jgi:hypothetical protein
MNPNDVIMFADNRTIINSGTCTDTGFAIPDRVKIKPARHIGGDYIINGEHTSSSSVSLLIKSTGGTGFTYARIQFY